MTRIIALSLLFALSHLQNLVAQDFQQLLRDMRERYNNAASLQITMTIRVFETASSPRPFYDDKAEIMKAGANYSYQLHNTELLLNGQYLVVVNKEEKQIICAKSDSKSRSAYQEKFPVNIDSILNLIESPVLLGVENGIEHYRMLQKDNNVKQIDFYIDANKKLLQKLEYQYVGGQLAVINFERFDTQVQFPENAFDESRYVKLVNGKLRPAKAFSGYQLIESKEN